MAESVELTSPTKYFCHECSQEVSPLNPLVELSCPECSSGFIEEVSQDLYEAQNSYVSDQDEVNIATEDDPSTQDETIDYLEEFGADYLLGQSMFLIEDDEDESPEMLRGSEMLRVLDLDAVFSRHVYARNMDRVDGLNPDGSRYSSDYLSEDNIDTLVSQFLDEAEISGPPALPEAQIKSLPTRTITKEHVDKGIQCTVCMNDFAFRETAKVLPCDHFYHQKCITPWLEMHATCPNCRKTIEIQANCRGRRSVSCPRASTHSDEESQHSSNSSASSSSSSSSLSDFLSTTINPFRFLH